MDTIAEKEQGKNNCHECKYASECELLKESMKPVLLCKLGVK